MGPEHEIGGVGLVVFVFSSFFAFFSSVFAGGDAGKILKNKFREKMTPEKNSF